MAKKLLMLFIIIGIGIRIWVGINQPLFGKVLVLLLVVPLLFFSLRRTITYTINPIYPEHMVIER